MADKVRIEVKLYFLIDLLLEILISVPVIIDIATRLLQT